METLSELVAAMQTAAGNGGLRALYSKILAANDNSKNQIYLGGGFGALNIIPHGDVVIENGPQGGAVRDRSYARIDFHWINENGTHPAPNTKLILYPRYPEVRLSGFLLGCAAAPNALMNVRTPGRILILGITAANRVLAYVVNVGSPIANELTAFAPAMIGVFGDLSALLGTQTDPIAVIRTAINRVTTLGWLPSVKLDTQGLPQPYAAKNGGGYTLEAALGIIPNGRSEPDYQGWEVKQYGVKDFTRLRSTSAVTLMTPEPDEGLYQDDLSAFMAAHGYPDRSGIPNRINFGGIYKVGKRIHSRTGLKLELIGFEFETGRFDINGQVQLVDNTGTSKASWTFPKLISHWSRKHAKAAYIPSIKRGPPPEYQFSNRIQLFIGTDFVRLLRAISQGIVYLDPALKQVDGRIHRRCQFRVHHRNLALLYEREVPGP